MDEENVRNGKWFSGRYGWMRNVAREDQTKERVLLWSESVSFVRWL